MERELAAARRKIDKLAAAVAAGAIGSIRQLGGAGILILSEPLPDDPDSFYPPPRSVVTPYLAELSWLFKQLGGAFRGLIELYDEVRVPRAPRECRERLPRGSRPRRERPGSPRSRPDQGPYIAAEMSDGTFVALPVAPGRAIAEDFMTKPENRAH